MDLKIQLAMARFGLWLIHKSRLMSSFFAPWRWALFERAERLGIHILPVHYYSPIPDSRQLVFDDDCRPFHSAADDVLDTAMTNLREFYDAYEPEFKEIAGRTPYTSQSQVTEFRFGLAPYSTVEAETLYSLIRRKKPKRIIEIGCGHTTFLISEAIRAENKKGYKPTYECIEPYRPNYLSKAPSEVTEFIETPLQAVSVKRFEALGPGDILFIDSSHVVSYGSDTVYELTQILPRLKSGVLVHLHDIFLPYEYPQEWLTKSRFFWTEQYMLNALIENNTDVRVRFPLHQLYRERRNDLEFLFPLLATGDHRPSAYWLEIV